MPPRRRENSSRKEAQWKRCCTPTGTTAQDVSQMEMKLIWWRLPCPIQILGWELSRLAPCSCFLGTPRRTRTPKRETVALCMHFSVSPHLHCVLPYRCPQAIFGCSFGVKGNLMIDRTDGRKEGSESLHYKLSLINDELLRTTRWFTLNAYF